MVALWSLFIGARQTGAGKRRFSAVDDRTLQRITAKHFPQGYTILEARGGWYDSERRRFVREESRQVLITTEAKKRVVRWASELGAAFEQKELLVMKLGRAHRLRIRQAGGRRARRRNPPH
jgi:hypothetical protein